MSKSSFRAHAPTRGLLLLILVLSISFVSTPRLNAQTTRPTITNVAASQVTATTAVITWTTNVAADSLVEYGRYEADFTTTPVDAARVTSHSMTLQNLVPDSLYSYRVRSRNAQGAATYSGIYTFTTQADGGGDDGDGGGGDDGDGGGDGGGGGGDATPPSVQITAPAPNQTVSGMVSVAANASDSSGVAGVTFRVDGQMIESEDTSAPYSVNLNTASMSNGAHTLVASARDMAGNEAASAPVTVMVNNSTPTAQGWYAAPNGSPSGDGSASRPWDLQTALWNATVRPGDTLYLRGGVYTGAFRSALTGTEGAPVVVRGYPGERAIIDGNRGGNPALTIWGNYAHYRDFEVRNSDTRRVASVSGSNPGTDWRKDGVTIYGSYVKVINLVIYDNADGIGFWDNSVNSEVYGCIIFNNGWLGPDRGHGHGIYIQNETGTKKIRNVISFNNFGTGMKAYAEGASAESVHFDGIISFENGSPEARGGANRNEAILLGTKDATQRDMRILNSAAYTLAGTNGGGLRLGYTSVGSDVEVRGNYVATGNNLQLNLWNMATVEDNTFLSRNIANKVTYKSGNGPQNYSIDNNRYFDMSPVRSGVRRPFGITGVRNANGAGSLSFVEWKGGFGWDRNSSYTEGPFSGTHVVVLPNEYEAGRANIAVYNWSGAATVAVDVSNVLAVGARYELRSVLDYFGPPVLSGTYGGGPLNVPMAGLRVVAPHGYDFTPASTAPEFGAFVLVTK